MIGILLNNQAYEQDIRELLMAFYPGETFAHEINPEVDFYVEGQVSEDKTRYTITVEDKQSAFPVEYENRPEAKSVIKRELYKLLNQRTGKVLPWGTLTGIRPAKLVWQLLEEGYSHPEVVCHMKEVYLAGDEKIDLCIETAENERRLLADLDYQRGCSLYIGIPFCPTTCLYCSFTSYPIKQWEGKTGLYLEALYQEMECVAEQMKGSSRLQHLDSVYFGGGTPTALSAGDLDALLTKLETTFDLSRIQELTVEAGRPDSITGEKLEVLKKHGVTRISINPQTMKQGTLDIIGRRHTVEVVKEQFYLARELGFDNINMDLIIGLPEETLEDVRNTMEEIRKLDPDSITVHSLAIKRAARLNMEREHYRMPSVSDIPKMIDLTARYAKEMGMKPYYLYRQKNMAGNFENVGYAKPGKACLYNVLIMEEKQTILACGAGTSTKLVFPEENRLERVENMKSVTDYVGRIGEVREKKKKHLQNLNCTLQ